jgi:hypothetical protein
MFGDEKIVEKIKCKLPYMFFIAEIEMSKSGKVGMEVGTLREQILIALLIYKFGYENVKPNPITTEDFDLKLYGKPVSIKTIKKSLPKRIGKFSGSGTKLIWTVDAQKAKEFRDNHYPHCDNLLVQINWSDVGSFYYIPLNFQKMLFDGIEKQNYIKLLKLGTNPRGV